MNEVGNRNGLRIFGCIFVVFVLITTSVFVGLTSEDLITDAADAIFKIYFANCDYGAVLERYPGDWQNGLERLASSIINMGLCPEAHRQQLVGAIMNRLRCLARERSERLLRKVVCTDLNEQRHSNTAELMADYIKRRKVYIEYGCCLGLEKERSGAVVTAGWENFHLFFETPGRICFLPMFVVWSVSVRPSDALSIALAVSQANEIPVSHSVGRSGVLHFFFSGRPDRQSVQDLVPAVTAEFLAKTKHRRCFSDFAPAIP